MTQNTEHQISDGKGGFILYCPIVNKPLRAYSKGITGDSAWNDRSKGRGLNTCTLCNTDKRTVAQRLSSLNESRKGKGN